MIKLKNQPLSTQAINEMGLIKRRDLQIAINNASSEVKPFIEAKQSDEL